MRTFCFYLIIVFIFFSFSQTTFAVSTTLVSTDCSITIKLRVGSRGAEVECLQKKIGVVADGSFGPLTKAAVLFFQSSNDLVTDGIVGPLTRAVLNGFVVNIDIYPVGCTSFVGYSPTTGRKCDSISSPLSLDSSLNDVNGSIKNVINSNPNLTNLDQFIKTVVEFNRKAGSSEEELLIISETLQEEVKNSIINYNKIFEELLINESKLSISFKKDSSLTFFDKIVSKTFSFLGIIPSTAQAMTGIPFGGKLLSSFYCPKSANWMIFITPLPPTSVVLLSYYPGTQKFASHNIPFTSWLLGNYISSGICSYGKVNIRTQGTITPMVGSSPL